MYGKVMEMCVNCSMMIFDDNVVAVKLFFALKWEMTDHEMIALAPNIFSLISLTIYWLKESLKVQCISVIILLQNKKVFVSHILNQFQLPIFLRRWALY